MKLLTEEQQESYENAKIYYICTEKFENKYLKDTTYCKVRDNCCYTRKYGGVAHSICNLKYSIPEKILVAFHNESNYGYHFITKELAEEFKKQFICLGENIEKYVTFTVLIEKKLQKLIKTENKPQKVYSTYYSLLVAQDLRQAHYQILSIIFLNKFIKSKVNTDNDKKCETCGIKLFS